MQSDVSRPAVKKIVVWSLLGCGGLIAIVAVVVVITAWRMTSALDDRKPEVIALTDKFVDCFYRGNVECVKSMTGLDEAMLSTTQSAAAQFANHLGARGVAVPIDESWTWKTFSSVAGKTKTSIFVTLNVAYTNDAHATETFEVIAEDGKLRVQHFRVNSPKLFVDPNTEPAPVDDGTER